MFIGHYAVAFLLKKKYKEVPLWLLFVAVQLVDILAAPLLILGVEHASYNPSPNPFLRSVFKYHPYTHSLFSNVVIALAVFLVFLKFRNKIWGLALSIGALSHWFLDAIVHAPDMPLFFDKIKLGLGLWQLPWIAFLLEIAFLAGAGYYLLKDSKNIKRHVILIILLIAGFAAMFFSPDAEATAVEVGIFGLVIYSLFPALAYWAGRKR
jgi:hypothetical protein